MQMFPQYPYWMKDNDTFLTTSMGWTGQNLRRIEDRNIAQPYLRMVRVRDYVRLGGHAPDGHALDDLDEMDIAHLRAGRSVLILDLSNEGPAFFSHIFDGLHRRLDGMVIPWERVAVVQQNLNLEPDYRRHYNDGRLTFIISDYYVKVVGSVFSRQHRNMTEEAAFRDSHYAPAGQMEDGPAYLCLNSALRWHRVLMFRYLMRSNLMTAGLVSFMGAGPDNPKSNEIDLHNPPSVVVAAFAGDVATIDDWIPRQMIRFDGGSDAGNSLVESYIPEAYARTCFSIVTESDFFNLGVNRITEKTMKAACMGHPLLVLGPPGSLLILQRYGFRTFADVFDEAYDDIEDPVERFHAVCRQVERAVAEARAGRHDWLRRVADAAVHNYEHGRTGFLKTYAEVVERRLFEQLSGLLRQDA